MHRFFILFCFIKLAFALEYNKTYCWSTNSSVPTSPKSLVKLTNQTNCQKLFLYIQREENLKVSVGIPFHVNWTMQSTEALLLGDVDVKLLVCQDKDCNDSSQMEHVVTSVNRLSISFSGYLTFNSSGDHLIAVHAFLSERHAKYNSIALFDVISAESSVNTPMLASTSNNSTLVISLSASGAVILLICILFAGRILRRKQNQANKKSLDVLSFPPPPEWKQLDTVPRLHSSTTVTDSVDDIRLDCRLGSGYPHHLPTISSPDSSICTRYDEFGCHSLYSESNATISVVGYDSRRNQIGSIYQESIVTESTDLQDRITMISDFSNDNYQLEYQSPLHRPHYEANYHYPSHPRSYYRR